MMENALLNVTNPGIFCIHTAPTLNGDLKYF